MTSKRFLSTTHLHIYAIINTIIKHKYKSQGIALIKILDVGCGNGLLLSTLVKELPLKNPGISFEFYGLDVDDSHVQEKGYFNKTISLLQSIAPQITWVNNLKLIASNDQWPFSDGFFDLIFSNQVMEHVFNQELFLKRDPQNYERRWLLISSISFETLSARRPFVDSLCSQIQ